MENTKKPVSVEPDGLKVESLDSATKQIFQQLSTGQIELDEAEKRLIEAAEASALPLPEILAALRAARPPLPASPSTIIIEATPNEDNPSPRAAFRPPTPGCLPPPPLEALPPAVQNLLLDASRVFGSLPLEVPLVSFLAFLSGCVGRSAILEIKPGWQVAGNLYWAIVAPSGLGKSPCANAFLRHLWRLDHQAREHWKTEMSAYQAAMEERKQVGQHPAGPVPPIPTLTQYIVDDATLEAISGILADNPRGLIWCCDELATLMQTLDRYGKSGNKARLLSAYDGAAWKTNRCEKGKNHTVLAAVLSIIGTIQPRTLKTVFSQKDADSGLLPRFAFILARRDQPPRLTDEDFQGETLLSDLAELLLKRKMTELNGRLMPEMVRLNAEAYGLYKNWNRELTQSTWDVSEIDRLIVPKVLGMVPRLALLLHVLASAMECLETHLPCLESDSGGLRIRPEVSSETMTGAIHIGDWIYRHQKHIWLSMGLDNEPLKTPLEEAVMRTALGLEDYLAENGWRILNDDFITQAQSLLPKDTAACQIGRTATRLGGRSVKIGRKRGREFPKELLGRFRLALYL